MPEDRKDSQPTMNPVVAFAGAETSTEDSEKYILACPPKDQIHPCSCTEVSFNSHISQFAQLGKLDFSLHQIENNN